MNVVKKTNLTLTQMLKKKKLTEKDDENIKQKTNKNASFNNSCKTKKIKIKCK